MTKMLDYGQPDGGAQLVAAGVMCEVEPCHGKNPATHLVPQSTDAGRTINWRHVCDYHADGWFIGSDWHGPIFKLVKVYPGAAP